MEADQECGRCRGRELDRFNHKIGMVEKSGTGEKGRGSTNAHSDPRAEEEQGDNGGKACQIMEAYNDPTKMRRVDTCVHRTGRERGNDVQPKCDAYAQRSSTVGVYCEEMPKTFRELGGGETE